MSARPATATTALPAEDARFIAAARLRAAREQPYMAAALFAMVPVAAPDYGTFAVDAKWRLYLDMEVAREWGVEGTAAVLLHEANHLVRNHHQRAAHAHVEGPRQRRLWNLAGDAAINDDLVADGLPLPDPLLPEHLDARPNQLEETYYRKLLGDDERRERACGSGAGGIPAPVELDPNGDDDTSVPHVDDIDAASVRRAVAEEVVAASGGNRRPSPGLQRWADELLRPQVPWRSLLRSAVRGRIRAVTGAAHPSWHRPDRRADARPEVLRPGVARRSAEVAVVIDTSASMSQDLLDIAVTEIDALLRRAGIRELTVVACDEHAVDAQRVRRVATLDLRGGGGTDLRIGIDAAAATRPPPSVIVVLTDGLTPWPDAAPPRTHLVCVVIGDEAPLPRGERITSIRIEGDG